MSNKIKIIILLALWFLTFLPIYPELVSSWFDFSDNSHCILVPAITLYFIWQKREALANLEIATWNKGALILIGALLVYIVSYLGGVAVVARSMIVMTLFGIIAFTLGAQYARTLLFPLLFLLFIVPVPDSLIGIVAFPLQLLATKISFDVINFFSIPVYREGNMLYFAQTQLEVAEACSGIRSILSYLMLSVIFAYLMKKGWKRRIALLLFSIPLALFANIIRVSGTGILAHFYGAVVARGFLHEFSGLIVFLFGFVLLASIFGLLNRGPSSTPKVNT